MKKKQHDSKTIATVFAMKGLENIRIATGAAQRKLLSPKVSNHPLIYGSALSHSLSL